MNSILGKGARPAKKPTNPRLYIATIMGILILIGFYLGVVRMSNFLHHHPYLMMLFPFFFIIMTVLLMPLLVFASFIDEFGSTVNPLNPKDYWFLMKKTWKALESNNWKITAKDL